MWFARNSSSWRRVLDVRLLCEALLYFFIVEIVLRKPIVEYGFLFLLLVSMGTIAIREILREYIKAIKKEFSTSQATEHSYRPALKTLLESLSPRIIALNESQRITGVGMPDFTIMKRNDKTIKIGWMEAKDLRVNLDEKKNTDQLKRYRNAFDNFVYTNNLTFHFYREGKRVQTVSL